MGRSVQSFSENKIFSEQDIERNLEMEKKKIIFYGGGGVAVDTARYILDIDSQFGGNGSVVVSDIIDEGEGRIDDLKTILGYQVAVHRDISTIHDFKHKFVVITLGKSPFRHEKFAHLKNLGAAFYSVIHPKSDIAASAKIGQSCIIAPYCVVSPLAVVEDNVLVNIRSTVAHDAVIGESTIISPHVAISGSVLCGKSVFAGAGVIVTQGVQIGDFAKISVGSVVLKDVLSGHLAHGNPVSSTRMFDKNTGRSLFEVSED